MDVNALEELLGENERREEALRRARRDCQDLEELHHEEIEKENQWVEQAISDLNRVDPNRTVVREAARAQQELLRLAAIEEKYEESLRPEAELSQELAVEHSRFQE